MSGSDRYFPFPMFTLRSFTSGISQSEEQIKRQNGIGGRKSTGVKKIVSISAPDKSKSFRAVCPAFRKGRCHFTVRKVCTIEDRVRLLVVLSYSFI